MGPVSVYRVVAVGADPSYFFGGEARDSDLRHAAWLGWLPLTLVEFAGPGVAVTDDTWLTAPAGRPDRLRRPVVGDVVSPLDAAGELTARRDSGLTVFTHRPGNGVLSDGLSWVSSLAVLVGDDLAVHVDRVRAAHLAVVEALDGVEQERSDLDARQGTSSGDSPMRRCCGRAVRNFQEEQLRLHVLLEAAVRIGVFDSGLASR